MAIRHIVTLGYVLGPGVGFIPTVGFSSDTGVAGPYAAMAGQSFLAGCVTGDEWSAGNKAGQVYLAGNVRGDGWQPGAVAAQGRQGGNVQQEAT